MNQEIKNNVVVCLNNMFKLDGCDLPVIFKTEVSDVDVRYTILANEEDMDEILRNKKWISLNIEKEVAGVKVKIVSDFDVEEEIDGVFMSGVVFIFTDKK
jgi:hypothetical protein